MLPILALFALLSARPKPTRPPDPVAIPGDPVAVFIHQRRGLELTGGLFDPHLARGFSFRIYENHIGREFRYGKTLLPCDPTDQTGYAYLPKTLLVALRKPSGQQIVVGDRHAFLVRSEAAIQTKLAHEEAFLAHHQSPPRTWGQRLGRLWRRTIMQEPYLKLAYEDGHEEIYRGRALGGALGELVLIPELDPSYTGDPKTASTTPAPVPGAMKVVRYLVRYEGPALQDLASFVHAKR